MKNIVFFLIIAVLGVLPISVRSEEKKVVCYWQGRIDIALIDPFICTHVIYAFADTDVDGNVFVIEAIGAKIRSLRTLKTQNPKLKTMVTLFSNFRVISTDKRVEFAQNLLTFVQDYELDGADIDWEWPSANDRENFELMLEEIGLLFKPRGLLLTAAVGACENLATSYEGANILKYIDFMNVMTYNLHGGTWENYTANPGNYWDSRSRYSLITCLNYWIRKGVPHDKMVVGIPTHSRNFILDDAAANGIDALATGKNFGPEVDQIPSSYSYNIICKNIQENGWTRRYDIGRSTGPYAFSGTTWSGYDDLESIREKAILVKKVNFAGVVFWSLDHDDHSNVCGDGKFPLIRSVWDIIN